MVDVVVDAKNVKMIDVVVVNAIHRLNKDVKMIDVVDVNTIHRLNIFNDAG